MTQLKSKNQSKQNFNKSRKLSAQEMCEELLRISKAEKWLQKSYQRFIDLIINPEVQYQLNTTQKQIFTDAILNCPSDYRSLVHLTLISANFNQPKGLYTLNGIIVKIKEYIVNFLKKKYELENLSMIENPNNLQKWLLTHKNINQNNKIHLCRNLISLLITEKKNLIIYLNIILDFFSGLNILEKDKSVDITEEKIKAITNFFQLDKPTTTEAQRLTLYGSYSQIEIQKQTIKIIELESQISQLKETLMESNTQSEQKDGEITNLKEKLKQTKLDLEQTQNELEKETQLYQQLDYSSQVKISQERNATIIQINNRIEHELKKLERCFNSRNIDNFAENQKIGLKILEKIKKQLLTEE